MASCSGNELSKILGFGDMYYNSKKGVATDTWEWFQIVDPTDFHRWLKF